MTNKLSSLSYEPTGQKLPKAELHCHLEGAAYPDLVRRLAARHGANLDDIIDDNGSYIWTDFTSFLQCWDRVAAVIRTPEDYADLVEDYLKRNAEEGCLYTEFFISPDHVALMGMSYDNLLEGVAEGYERAKTRSEKDGFPIEARFIVTCVRHMGPEKAIGVANTVANRPHPLVTGFGMGGDERMHSQKAFAPAYEIATEAGLKCTTHAGEFGGPESVIDALDHLPVDRIGHGVRSSEDTDLMKRLVDENIVLEVCPGSNVSLGLYDSRKDHPIDKLIQAGIKTTISSDDPPFFHTSIGEDYDAMAQIKGWDRTTMLGFTKRSLQAAYLDETTRCALCERVK
ncbi:adenosine deaminase [Cohaesibacter gelatinilyticus]|uniref:Adenosine deaminase n=1 Tax=Cohaesibacter gelatinilyticus TaxID=372072 RepID=A0A285PG75_9HYPH|nr:adenosine deaminase [Cohaesibacter gelatinilyticus]SNZ20699.1 adenosine deaminase [Cohaesibacter gelatinilyticus]HAT86037.1 adenosine deaminase [Hyphomicrobiales bacterium]